jgi:hypothetical protein
MEALLILGALVAGVHHFDEESEKQLLDPNPAMVKVIHNGSGQYFVNNIQQESEVQWIISTN